MTQNARVDNFGMKCANPIFFKYIFIIENVVIITIEGSNKIVNFMTTVSGGFVQGVNRQPEYIVML
mgnify:CR=1 FL=1